MRGDETAEAFLRRVSVGSIWTAPGVREIQSALREHLAALDAERQM